MSLRPYKQSRLAVLPTGAIAETVLDDAGYVAARWHDGTAWGDFQLVTGPGVADVGITAALDGTARISTLDREPPAGLPIEGRRIYAFAPSGATLLEL